MLYTTCGSTDLSLHGITFASKGIEKFMGTVMRIDDQDLVSRMEGFAVQGVKGGSLFLFPSTEDSNYYSGAVDNYQQRVSNVRGTIREIINAELRKCYSCPFINYCLP